MEAGGGIEPPISDLQSGALPLCYPAGSGGRRRRVFSPTRTTGLCPAVAQRDPKGTPTQFPSKMCVRSFARARARASPRGGWGPVAERLTIRAPCVHRVNRHGVNGTATDSRVGRHTARHTHSEVSHNASNHAALRWCVAGFERQRATSHRGIGATPRVRLALAVCELWPSRLTRRVVA